MKKIMMMLVAALTLSSAATAQGFRLNVADHQRKMADSDAEIQDTRRAGRANTWVTRGGVYYKADVAPTERLYRGMEEININLLIGAPREKREEEVRGELCQVYVYPDFDLYLTDGRVAFWRQKTVIAPNGFDVAFEAYTKAAELDARQAGKMKDEIRKIIDLLNQYANNNFLAANYAAAATEFAKAYEFSTSTLGGPIDTLAIFNAGYVSVLNENYTDAQKYLAITEQLGYDGGDGELYYYQYLVHNFGDKNMAAAEAALRTGIQKYPSNSQLIEALILLYTTTGQDASQIIPLVQEAQQKDPGNYVYSFGLGLIYNKLDNFAQAAAEFKKASDMNPQDYASAFNLGLTYLRQADAMLPEINAIPINTQQELYNQKMGEFNALYKQALPYMQRAYGLNAEDRSVVEILRSIYFRFREESPEMMQNYEKYNQLLQTM